MIPADVTTTQLGALTVIITAMPWAHSCAGILDLPGGFAEDATHLAGLAHLTEHISVAEAVRRSGVPLQARTYADGTRYAARTARRGTASLIDALTSPLRPEPHGEDLHRRETHALLTEVARLRDSPQLQVAGAVGALSFPGAGAAARDLTTVDSVSSVTPTDVLRFRQDLARRPGAILSLAGRVQAEELLDLIAARLGPVAVDVVPGPPAPRQEPPARSGEWLDGLFWTALPPRAAGDNALAARLIATELVASTGGLLDGVAAGHGRASNAYATVPERDRDVLVVGWTAGAIPAGLPAALHDLRYVDADGNREAVAAARARVRARIAFTMQAPGGLAELLLNSALSAGPWPDLAALDEVPAEQVVAAAEAILRTAVLWQTADGQLSRYGEAS